MKPKLKSTILILVAALLVSCEPSVENGLTYDEYIKKASQYRNDNDYDRAIAAGKKAVSIKPSDGETHYLLAVLYDEAYRKSFDAAQKKQIQDLFLNPNRRRNQDYMEELKKFGLKAEWKTLSIQECRETVKYSPTNWGARYLIATDYSNNKKFREAIDEFKKVMEINPNYVNSYSLTGKAYYELGEYESAIQSLQTAIRKDSASTYSYYYLGLVYQKINNRAKVVEIKKILKSKNSSFYNDLQ